MALTVVQFETILIKRVGKLLTALGMDGTTIDGDNADLLDPMGTAIRQMGASVATITDVIDADLTDFAETQYDELFDRAELRTLESAYTTATIKIDTKIGPRDEKLSKLADSLAKRLAAKQKQVDSFYLSSDFTITTAIVDFDFDTLS